MLFTTVLQLLYYSTAVCCCRLCTKQIPISVYSSPNIATLSSLPILSKKSMRSRVFSLEESNDPQDGLKDFMLDSIKWYKKSLSPIMPPNCRFLPTCSSYGLKAIETYGPWKGGLLTAWRIVRCNPFGGSGYDPPIWPPPSYFAGSTTRRKRK